MPGLLTGLLTLVKAELNEAGNNLGPYWERTKDVVLRPGTLGGLMGVGTCCHVAT